MSADTAPRHRRAVAGNRRPASRAWWACAALLTQLACGKHEPRVADAAAPPAPPAPVPVLHPTASPAPSGPERSADTLDISRSHDAGRVFDDWLSAYRGLEQADPGASWKELPPPRSEAEARARLCDAREENERCAGSGPWLVDVVFSQFYVASYLLARAPGRARGGKLIAFGRIVSKGCGSQPDGSLIMGAESPA